MDSSILPLDDYITCKCFHLDQCCAACCVSCHHKFGVFSSEVTVLLQFVFCPRFLFSGRVHLRATLGTHSWSIQKASPSHPCSIPSSTLYRSSPEVFSGQNIWHFYRRHPVRNTLIFLVALSSTRRHSKPQFHTAGSRFWGCTVLFGALYWCLRCMSCPYWGDLPGMCTQHNQEVIVHSDRCMWCWI